MRVPAAVLVPVAILVALLAAGCSSPGIPMRVGHDPIPAIVERAAASGRWNVHEAGQGTADLSETWFVDSFVVQGLTRFHAELEYTAPTLSARFYVKSRGVKTLGLAENVELDDDAPEAERMRRSARELLDWGEIPAESRPPQLR